MDNRFETKESFRVVGYSLELGTDLKVSQKKIAEFWTEIMGSEKITPLAKLVKGAFSGMLGVSIDYVENEEWMYLIAVATTAKLPDGMIEYVIPSADWAIFSRAGIMPDAVQEAQLEILEKWLPASGYAYDAAVPNLEVYLTGEAKDLNFEIWLPIKRK